MKRIAYGAAVLVALLVLAQLVLPPIAERQVRADAEARGATVQGVEVAAVPALKLLWGRADRVRLRLGEVRLDTPGDLAAELARTRGVDRLDASVTALRLGRLTLRDLRLRKRRSSLSGEAALTRADLSAALPLDLDLEPVEAAQGALVLRASAGPVAVRARLSARDGKLLIAPDGLLGTFAALTVFDDPRLGVDAVGARPRPDGFTLTAEGRLR